MFVRRSAKLGLVGFCLLAMSALIASVGAQDTPPAHWTYEGEEGADHWGEIDPAYTLCGDGQGQSPIDLNGPIEANLVNIEFSYNPSALNIFNNGHTIQVLYDESSNSTITYNETIYRLLQFHFHHPSEHTINGKPADLELHLVHQDVAGNLAVVGVMLVVGDTPDPDYAVLFDNLPPEQTEPPMSTDLKVNAIDLLPDTRTFYTYSGSLTTPPCSQGVRWLVLDTPVTISQAQADAFSAIFELNARPVQPLNERDLLHDNAG